MERVRDCLVRKLRARDDPAWVVLQGIVQDNSLQIPLKFFLESRLPSLRISAIIAA
jgi:hypothetical protein